MKSFFLKTKGWQIFLLMCFVPMLLQIIYQITAGVPTNQTYVPGSPVFAFTIYGFYLLWVYSIADFFTKLLNQTPKYLKISFAISFIYILYYSFFVLTNIHYIGSSGVRTLLHFTLQILFMIVFFYLLYHASKALRAVELNREVSFRDAFADFLCFLFFPVGVWFVQPRVRKLYRLSNEAEKTYER